MIHQLGVSKTRGTPKSSILIGFSLINHPFWGATPIFGNIQFLWMVESLQEGDNKNREMISVNPPQKKKSLKLGKEGNDGQSPVIFTTYIFHIHLQNVCYVFLLHIYVYIYISTGWLDSVNQQYRQEINILYSSHEGLRWTWPSSGVITSRRNSGISWFYMNELGSFSLYHHKNFAYEFGILIFSNRLYHLVCPASGLNDFFLPSRVSHGGWSGLRWLWSVAGYVASGSAECHHRCDLDAARDLSPNTREQNIQDGFPKFWHYTLRRCSFFWTWNMKNRYVFFSCRWFK